MVRPTFSASMRSASCRTLKCADIVGFETSKWSASSPADNGPVRSSCRTRRRVGSASALNTRFTSRYLANYRNVCQVHRSSARPSARADVADVEFLDDERRRAAADRHAVTKEAAAAKRHADAGRELLRVCERLGEVGAVLAV